MTGDRRHARRPRRRGRTRSPRPLSGPGAPSRSRRSSRRLSGESRTTRTRVRRAEPALAEDVVCVLVAPGAAVEAPIEIVFDGPAADEPAVLYPRCLIVAGDRSEATVVERHTGTGAYFRNAVTEIALGEGAVLRHYKLQRESLEAFHLQSIAVRQARASHFRSVLAAFGGALARTDIRVDLDGEGSECILDGLFVGAGTQHLDTHTTIDHVAPHSHEPRALQGRARRPRARRLPRPIVVRPGAQKTDAMQTNKNLLLSRDALVDSTPALEIFADDVKCKHGSTIGQLDRGGALLPALAGHRRARGPGAPDLRFRRRRGGPRRPAGPARGDRGDARPLRFPMPPGRRPREHRPHLSDRPAAAGLRRRRHPRGLSDPLAPRARQAARLSRQRRHDAEAARRDRRRARLLRALLREHPPRRAPALGRGDRRVRAAREKARAFLNARADARDRLRPRHDGGDQPRGLELRRRPRPRRATRS